MNENNFQIVQISERYLHQVQELLRQISPYAADPDAANEIWCNFSAQSNLHSVVCLLEGKVVGYGSLIIEFKIRGGKLGHIEDIVTHTNFRNLGIGSAVIHHLLKVAQREGCYKVVLSCSEKNVGFYEKCEFEPNSISMTKLFKP